MDLPPKDALHLEVQEIHGGRYFLDAFALLAMPENWPGFDSIGDNFGDNSEKAASVPGVN